MAPSSQGERLARIETLLEGLAEDFADMRALRDDHEKDKAELAALKNNGAGLLIGVGLAGRTVGAFLAKVFAGLFN